MALTGLHSQYTFMPRCAYIVGRYTVEKEGTLVIEENAEPEIIQTLLDEGIIRDEDAPQTETVCEETPEEPSEIAEAEEFAEAEETVTNDQPDEEPKATAEESSVAEEPHEDADPSAEPIEESSADEDDFAEEEEPIPEEQPAAEEVDELTISLPMAGHTAQSIRNFLNLMYSRGPLLNKAMGTSFSVSNSLLDALEQASVRTVT